MSEPLDHSFGATSVDPNTRRRLIRDVFENVASRYNLMNDLMSFGIHRLWKRAFVRQMAEEYEGTAGLLVLDLAGGTGDIAFALTERCPGLAMLVCDPSRAMMQQGRKRTRSRIGSPRIGWIGGEAEALPLADSSMDGVAISFGIRNVTRLRSALAEIRRVLRPGGRFYCLEFSTPAPWLEPAYRLHSRLVIPLLGSLVAGNRLAYRYLIESIARFPPQAELATLIADAGFVDVRWRNLSFGIVALHCARRE